MKPVKVWKFELGPGMASLYLPKGATPLRVGAQGQSVVLWALVDPDAEIEARTFVAIPTGGTVPDGPIAYLGTAQLRSDLPLFPELVFHVFEVGEPAPDTEVRHATR